MFSELIIVNLWIMSLHCSCDRFLQIDRTRKYLLPAVFSQSWFTCLFLQVWLVWTDKTNERQEKSIRQLAQEARQGNAHDENVLTYYRQTQSEGSSPGSMNVHGKFSTDPAINFQWRHLNSLLVDLRIWTLLILKENLQIQLLPKRFYKDFIFYLTHRQRVFICHHILWYYYFIFILVPSGNFGPSVALQGNQVGHKNVLDREAKIEPVVH